MKDIMGKNSATEIQKRREDVFSALYIEEMTFDMVVELSGYAKSTIKKDLQYIKSHLNEFDSHNLPERILVEVEDKY